jgi:hypothetical protein
VNHACFAQANLELVYEEAGPIPGVRQLALTAKQYIEKGEWLAWDYNIALESCRCRSDKHRQISGRLDRRIIRVELYADSESGPSLLTRLFFCQASLCENTRNMIQQLHSRFFILTPQLAD